MGRITVFGIDNCPNSLRVQHAFESRQIPCTMISISKYPDKLNDLIHLCGRFSLPQVYFNAKYIGGADETIELLEKEWDNNNKSSSAGFQIYFSSIRERYEFEIGSRADPTNPLLQIPSAEENTGNHDGHNAENDCETIMDDDIIQLSNGEKAYVLHFIEKLKAIIPKQDIQLNNVTYKNCFSGESLVHAIMFEYYGRSTKEEKKQREVELFCNQLLKDKRIFSRIDIDASRNSITSTIDNNKSSSGPARSRSLGRSVSSRRIRLLSQTKEVRNTEHYYCHSKCQPAIEEIFLNTDDCYYRLECYETPEILNSYRNYYCSVCAVSRSDALDRINSVSGINSLLVYLFKLMKNIESSCTNSNGKINYKKASQDQKNFPIFEQTVCQLQKIDFKCIRDNKTKIAFALNVFNLMLNYAFIKLGIPSPDSDLESESGSSSRLLDDSTGADMYTNTSSRSTFLENVKFNIGGYIFSFQDWFHGIIRGNRAAPPSFRSMSSSSTHSSTRRLMRTLSVPRNNSYFQENDDRNQLLDIQSAEDDDHISSSHVHPIQSLVHFGILSRFTTNSPPINYFTIIESSSSRESTKKKKTSVQEELILSSFAFCENDKNVLISHEERKVVLANFFRKYQIDFRSSRSNNNGQELLSMVCQFLCGNKRVQMERLLQESASANRPIQIIFKNEEESWTTHVSDYIPFDSKNLATKTSPDSPRSDDNNESNNDILEKKSLDQSTRRRVIRRCKTSEETLMTLRESIRPETNEGPEDNSGMNSRDFATKIKRSKSGSGVKSLLKLQSSMFGSTSGRNRSINLKNQQRRELDQEEGEKQQHRESLATETTASLCSVIDEVLKDAHHIYQDEEIDISNLDD